MKWLVRIAAGVALGLIVAIVLSGDRAPGALKAWMLIGVSIIVFVGWFEAKDRDKFIDDLFDDDDRRGPPGIA